ncbi:uncharacterized protein LOC108628026 isoform X2 [Ceratina calcarata]|uniref:Uncharacterized protein LOC108628026 isoform X2 n=1 Tax=Ceratina calcarata TaxID=156304 RepID=A0AAJ7J5R9_9HYME|nr:uncharacterized protein LOC108628026 isoform X2 [Ceratina calcarata]
MISSIVSRLVILVFGNLYPAYASYKAVRTKNVKEYVKWMMYWIVFALFTCAETFTDVFFSFWFPFYYEIKTILVIWLLSPATKGSSILYRRFVHPALIRREAEIDDALARATEQGYTAVLHLGSKGVNYATTVLMQTAIKGGGGLVQHLKKSYSLSDLTGEKEDENRNMAHMHDETDMEVEPRRREHAGRRGYSPRRTQSTNNRVEMYFSEVDVDVRQAKSRESTASLTNIRSSDDVSSGYSSGEALQSTRTSQADSLVRTSSVGARTRAKPRSTAKKTPEDSGEDSNDIGIDPPSHSQITCPIPTLIPTPNILNLVTPEQALEILLLLSQNNQIGDYAKFGSGHLTAGNRDSLEDMSNASRSVAQLEQTNANGNNNSPSDCLSRPALETVPSTELKNESSSDATQTQQRAVIVNDETFDDEKNIQISDAAVHTPTTATDAAVTVADELCKDKFDELKQLLSDTRKAVDDIVSTRKTSRGSEHDVCLNPDDTNTSRRIDDSAVERFGRAGKYNKKPAPKVPLARDERRAKSGEDDDSIEADAQNAFKATLVIKTGILKSFSNATTTKDTFVARPRTSSNGSTSRGTNQGDKSKRQRTKEGFSIPRFFAIPKNIFHGAFHKSRDVDDERAGLSHTESQTRETEWVATKVSESDSDSIPVLNDDDDEANNGNDDRSSSSSSRYVLASNETIVRDDRDGETNAGYPVETVDSQKTENDGDVEIDREERVSPSSSNLDATTGGTVSGQTRETSPSPKSGERFETDIF